MKFKAVIFDLGGVILTSPFPVFSHFERQHKLPDGAILSLIKQGGDRGAWAALERGDMDVDTFTRAFAAEARDLMELSDSRVRFEGDLMKMMEHAEALNRFTEVRRNIPTDY